jgi:hypothetical protein
VGPAPAGCHPPEGRRHAQESGRGARVVKWLPQNGKRIPARRPFAIDVLGSAIKARPNAAACLLLPRADRRRQAAAAAAGRAARREAPGADLIIPI